MKGRRKFVKRRFVSLLSSKKGDKFKILTLYPVKEFDTILDTKAEGIRINDGLLFNPDHADDICFKAAERIYDLGKRNVLVRLRAYGRFEGKRRIFTAYMRVSKSVKAYKQQPNPTRKIEWIAKLLTSALLRRARSFKASFSPEQLRRKDDKKNARFWLDRVVIDAVVA